jgi:hypothetical protein
VLPADGTAELSWHIAADDRWYSPETEATLRQKWYAGFPVSETRVRIPGGDMVQRVYCVADQGGMTIMEFDNESNMPVAVAVTRSDVLTTRQPANNPPQGIDLPTTSMMIPIGHRSMARVALLHKSPAPGVLPEATPLHQQVVRGWETACDIASRMTLPDHTVVAGIARVRSNLLLGVDITEDAFIELVRLGETHHDSIMEVVDVVQRRVKAEKKSSVLQWDTPHVLATAARACVLLNDDLAAGDIAAVWSRLSDRAVAEPPIEVPEGIAAVAWAETLLVQASPSDGVCTLLPYGIPQPWWGTSFDVKGLIADPHHTLSYAVRWHGERPALLWEVSGPPGLLIQGGAADQQWHTTDASGEVLLAAPAGAVVAD